MLIIKLWWKAKLQQTTKEPRHWAQTTGVSWKPEQDCNCAALTLDSAVKGTNLIRITGKLNKSKKEESKWWWRILCAPYVPCVCVCVFWENYSMVLVLAHEGPTSEVGHVSCLLNNSHPAPCTRLHRVNTCVQEENETKYQICVCESALDNNNSSSPAELINRRAKT